MINKHKIFLEKIFRGEKIEVGLKIFQDERQDFRSGKSEMTKLHKLGKLLICSEFDSDYLISNQRLVEPVFLYQEKVRKKVLSGVGGRMF